MTDREIYIEVTIPQMLKLKLCNSSWNLSEKTSNCHQIVGSLHLTEYQSRATADVACYKKELIVCHWTTKTGNLLHPRRTTEVKNYVAVWIELFTLYFTLHLPLIFVHIILSTTNNWNSSTFVKLLSYLQQFIGFLLTRGYLREKDSLNFFVYNLPPSLVFIRKIKLSIKWFRFTHIQNLH